MRICRRSSSNAHRIAMARDEDIASPGFMEGQVLRATTPSTGLSIAWSAALLGRWRLGHPRSAGDPQRTLASPIPQPKSRQSH